MLQAFKEKSSVAILVAAMLFSITTVFAQKTTDAQIREIQKLYKESYPLFTKGDSAALPFAERLKKIAATADESIVSRYATLRAGHILRPLDQYAARDYFEKNLEKFEQEQDTILADAYSFYSRIVTSMGEYPPALKYMLDAVELDRALNDTYREVRDLASVGYIHDRMYEFRESIKWSKEALEIALANDDLDGQSDAYNNLGIAYDELAERNGFDRVLFDSALYYNKKSLAILELKKDYGGMRVDYSNIGNSYSKLGDYKMAEEYTLKSLNVPGFEDRKGVTLVNLGKIYLETGRYDEARKILDSAMRNTIAYGNKKYQFEAYYRMHELDIKLGNYKSALENYIAYKSIEDSLLNDRKNQQVVEMNTRFKTAQKERDLAQTRADLVERDIEVKRKNNMLYGSIALIVILGVLGYLVYNQQKLKNRQLKKESELKEALARLETQNRLEEQRLRISRDLHDNIGSQLTFIISAIGNLKFALKDDLKITSKLDEIGDFTKRTINELRDTIWAMNKTSITWEELQPRIADFINSAKRSTEDIDFQYNLSDKIPAEYTFTSVEGINVYRIIQEAVNNSMKYASPNVIELYIAQPSEMFLVQIKDDGNGFDTENYMPGNGIKNMKKRAQEINADFALFSSINGGTRIELRLGGLGQE